MIFCLVAVALTTALQQTVEASILLRDESQVRLELQNLLTETAAQKFNPGKSEVKVGDGRVHYEREIRAVQAKTAAGVVLQIYTKSAFRPLGKPPARNGRIMPRSLFTGQELNELLAQRPHKTSGPGREAIAPVTCSWKCCWRWPS